MREFPCDTHVILASGARETHLRRAFSYAASGRRGPRGFPTCLPIVECLTLAEPRTLRSQIGRASYFTANNTSKSPPRHPPRSKVTPGITLGPSVGEQCSPTDIPLDLKSHGFGPIGRRAMLIHGYTEILSGPPQAPKGSQSEGRGATTTGLGLSSTYKVAKSSHTAAAPRQ